jgi:hypothetical protein
MCEQVTSLVRAHSFNLLSFSKTDHFLCYHIGERFQCRHSCPIRMAPLAHGSLRGLLCDVSYIAQAANEWPPSELNS